MNANKLELLSISNRFLLSGISYSDIVFDRIIIKFFAFEFGQLSNPLPFITLKSSNEGLGYHIDNNLFF